VTRKFAVIVAWGALIGLVTWFAYDFFVFALLVPPMTIGLFVGVTLATHFLTLHAGTVGRRFLRSGAYVAAVVGSVLDIAYFVWWGIAFDAADSMTPMKGPDLEPWLYGASVACIALSIFIAGVAWLWWWSGRRVPGAGAFGATEGPIEVGSSAD
jgi:hypothetical protein